MSDQKSKKGLMLIVGLGVALLVLMMIASSNKPAAPAQADSHDKAGQIEAAGHESPEELASENAKLQLEIANVQHQIEELNGGENGTAIDAETKKESGTK